MRSVGIECCTVGAARENERYRHVYAVTREIRNDLLWVE